MARKHALNVYLGPGTVAQISFSHGEPTPDDIDALVEQLQLTKRFLSRGRPQSAAEPERLRDLETEDNEAGLP